MEVKGWDPERGTPHTLANPEMGQLGNQRTEPKGL